MNLWSKTAVITGGAMGIGFSTAKRLLKEDCKVTIWDSNEKTLAIAKKLLQNEGFEAFTYLCDVTDKKQVYEHAQYAFRDMGQVDILINNAGFRKGGDFLETIDETWEKTIDVNLTSILYTIRAFLPGMYERNSGHIINISSAAATLGVPNLAVYSATKWAVWGLTESMRMEAYTNGKTGVKWSSIHPSYIAQGMSEDIKMKNIWSFIVPFIKDDDVVAKTIVESAIKKGRYSPKCPWTVNLNIRLRGLLPDYLFQKLMILMGIPHSMERWQKKPALKKTVEEFNI